MQKIAKKKVNVFFFRLVVVFVKLPKKHSCTKDLFRANSLRRSLKNKGSFFPLNSVGSNGTSTPPHGGFIFHRPRICCNFLAKKLFEQALIYAISAAATSGENKQKLLLLLPPPTLTLSALRVGVLPPRKIFTHSNDDYLTAVKLKCPTANKFLLNRSEI